MTPLAGVTVIVTRPARQAARLAALLREAGATVIALPTIEIEPLELDPAACARLAPDDFDWTIFTSANAVESALRQLPRPTRCRIAAIGRATARALAQHGIAVDAVPDGTPDSEGLLALEPFAAPRGRRILILKGAGGRPWLREELARRGAEVVVGDLYRRAPAPVDDAELAALRLASEQPGLAVMVTSGEVLGAFLEAASSAGTARLRDTALVVPGERVATLAGEHGWRGPLIVAGGAEDEAMLAALVRHAARRGPGTGA